MYIEAGDVPWEALIKVTETRTLWKHSPLPMNAFMVEYIKWWQSALVEQLILSGKPLQKGGH